VTDSAFVARARFLDGLDVRLKDPSWISLVSTPVPVGTPTSSLTRVPQADAQRILRAVVRLVADLPVGSTPEVVWTLGRSELLVHTAATSIVCTVGLVRIGVRVECDQTDGPVVVRVPLAVGTEQAPAGLVMQTYDRVDAPAAVADVWSDAITAFAWEALLETARRICADLGLDTRGRPLVPGGIAAASGALLLQPMARHELGLRPPS
jgi:hypothetical protein